MSSLYYRRAKDKNFRNCYNYFEKKKKIYKFFLYNTVFSKRRKLQVSKNFFLIHKNASITKIRNRCIISGRARSVFRDFKLSRTFFKRYANKGKLVGVSKHS
jgi:ribosomal protein S14